jgi:hypothetical protein
MNDTHKLAEELKLNEQSIKTIKFGEFDKTWCDSFSHLPPEEVLIFLKAFNYRFEDGYHVLDSIPPENILKEKSHWLVDYRYNKDWYRSDNFIKDHDGLHILFAGCSNTEGVGCNVDNVWPTIVYNKISEDYKVSGFFNLGRGGYGWQKIISAVLKYCNEYGKPDILLVNHPNILRDYYWSEKDKQWIYTQQFPYATDRHDQDKIIEQTYKENVLFSDLGLNPYPTLEEERNAFPVWLTAWNLFIEFCKSNDIKIVWTIWDDPTGNNITEGKLFQDTFFRIGQASEEFIQKHRPDGKFKDGDLNGRDGHPGYLTNLVWAEGFLKQIKDREIIDEVYKKSTKEA